MNVKIEKLVYGGEGLGHFEGSTVFVPFVMPGEVVAVRAVERKKKFVRGHVQQVVTPSPERAVPSCKHFAACGGCHYQHIPYEAQLNYKAEILRETLGRLGRVKWEGDIQEHASPPLGYRNRAQWKVKLTGEPGAAAGKPAIGYHRAGSSALQPVDECPILSPRLEQVLGGLRAMLAGGQLPAALREVEAFVDGNAGKLLLNASLTSFEGSAEALAGKLRGALPGIESILLHESSTDRFELFGPGYISYAAGGNNYRVGHLSFFQVNRFLVEEMAQAVAAEAGGELALDLFAGVGLFTLPLAKHFQRVVAVESNEAAARDLKANIEAAGVAARAVVMDTEKYLAGCKESPDLVVLDPPRAGVDPAALQCLIALGPARIAYFSCDPATLARDLGVLTGAATGTGGAYAIKELHVFDVFPQTFHIEALVRLERRA